MTTLLHLIETPGLLSQCNFIGTHKCKRRGKGLTLFLTEVSSMTTCLGRGNCTHAFIAVLVQKTHINPISIVQNKGIIGAKYFITLGKTAKSSLSWIRGAGFLFC